MGKNPVCFTRNLYYMIPQGRGIGTTWSLRSLPTEPFYDSVILYVYVSYYAEVALSPKTTHINSIISLRDTVKWNSIFSVIWSINLAMLVCNGRLCVHMVKWRDLGSFGSYCWPCSASITKFRLQNLMCKWEAARNSKWVKDLTALKGRKQPWHFRGPASSFFPSLIFLSLTKMIPKLHKRQSHTSHH